MALPEDIVIRVQRDFSSKESLPILQLLSEFQKENPDLSARVLRCIVFLARGSFENFASAVALARLDWRDLIVAAEYDGWSGEESKRRDMNLPFEATDNEAVKGPVPLTH